MTDEELFEKWWEDERAEFDYSPEDKRLSRDPFLAALEIGRKAEELLIEIGQNQETIIFGQPSEQLDANEPRYELKIIGPERLLKQLLELVGGGFIYHPPAD